MLLILSGTYLTVDYTTLSNLNLLSLWNRFEEVNFGSLNDWMIFLKDVASEYSNLFCKVSELLKNF